jgi:hypothetical protein
MSLCVRTAALGVRLQAADVPSRPFGLLFDEHPDFGTGHVRQPGISKLIRKRVDAIAPPDRPFAAVTRASAVALAQRSLTAWSLPLGVNEVSRSLDLLNRCRPEIERLRFTAASRQSAAVSTRMMSFPG